MNVDNIKSVLLQNEQILFYTGFFNVWKQFFSFILFL